MKRSAKLTLAILVVVSCAGCDQATKALASSYLMDREPLSVLGGFLRFTYALNPGAFLSLGASLSEAVRFWVLTVGASIGTVGVLWFLLTRRAGSILEVVGLSLIAGGSVGNLIDRARFGMVRDFVVVGLGQLTTGVFNGADTAITLGAGMLLVTGLWRRDRGSGTGGRT